MPAKLIVCSVAVSSGIAAGLVMASIFGASLISFTTTSKVSTTVSVPPLPSDTVTVTVAVPCALATGV